MNPNKHTEDITTTPIRCKCGRYWVSKSWCTWCDDRRNKLVIIRWQNVTILGLFNRRLQSPKYYANKKSFYLHSIIKLKHRQSIIINKSYETVKLYVSLIKHKLHLKYKLKQLDKKVQVTQLSKVTREGY